MALFLIILMIIGIRAFGFGIRVFGRLLGLWITLIIVGSILSAMIGLTIKALPLILVIAGICWLVRRSDTAGRTDVVETDYRF